MRQPTYAPEKYVNDPELRHETIEGMNDYLADYTFNNKYEHIALEALKRVNELEQELNKQ